MIIRMTVYDNDFTSLIETFAEDLYDKIYWVKSMPEGYPPEDWIEKEIKPREKLKQIIDGEIGLLGTSDIKLVQDAVFDEWSKYVDTINTHPDTKEYLKKNFESETLFTYEDKWENDEVVYYFTNARKWISQ